VSDPELILVAEVHHLAATVHALDPNPPDPGKLG
jgi:hypothetical protein